MEATSIFSRNLKAVNEKRRVVVNQGGTSSSKTWSILQLLIFIALRRTWIISIVSESMPHLKRGAMRDFFRIMESEGIYSEASHNKTDHSYKIGNSLIEFFSADNDDKVRGARRDVLFLNECNNVTYYVFDQLEVRTDKLIIVDFNPISEFWVHDKVLTRDDAVLIKSTYRDNRFLSDNIRRSIEIRRTTDPQWWTVYGEGELGRGEGVIFTHWKQCKEMPDNYQWQVYGQDFGFTNDPTTLYQIRLSGGELWVHELIYETALTNQDIINRYKELLLNRRDVIWADSAEPKSIEEIYRAGFNIKPAPKGPDSIRAGIDQIKKYPLNVTQESVNLIKELRNYRWTVDKEGRQLNTPIDGFNHGIDALRYGVMGKMTEKAGRILIAKVV